MAGVAGDADAAAGRTVRQLAADTGHRTGFERRTADAAAPNVDGLAGPRRGDRCDPERGRRSRIHLTFQHRQVPARDQRQDAGGHGAAAVGQPQREGAVGRHVLGGENPDPVPEASDDRARSHPEVVARVGDHHDRAVGRAALGVRGKRLPEREGDGRERCDGGASGQAVQR